MITRAGILLLLAVLINVAVAWGCTWIRVDMMSYVAAGYTQVQRPRWHVTICRRPGAVRLFGLEPGEKQEREWMAAGSPRPTPIVRSYLPAWSQFNGSPRGEVVRVVEDARGWPMVSLRSTFWMRAESIVAFDWTSEWVGGIELPPRLAANSLPVWEVRALPLIPTWPGFAVNTLVYAAMLSLPFAASGFIRRRRRKRRGRCPACGYPIGTSPVCTECGRALARS